MRFLALALPLLLAACSATKAVRAPAVYEASWEASPAPLKQSLFAKDVPPNLTEEGIGRILDAPVELQLPARVGVAMLGRAFSPESAALGTGLAAGRELPKALETTGLVALAFEVSPDLPTAPGIGGLRELAARYRAPYLLVYTERFEDHSHANGWSALWLTVVGGLVAPSRTLEGEGVLQVSLLEVRTGTLLFTQQEHIRFEEKHSPVGAERAWERLARKAADDAAAGLSKRVAERFARMAAPTPSPEARPTEPPRTPGDTGA